MYYTFKLVQPGEAGELLGTFATLGEAMQVQESSYTRPGPAYLETSRGFSPQGNACRITFEPYRRAIGAIVNYQRLKPWIVAIDGEIVNHYATQQEARARVGYCVPAMLDEHGLRYT